MRLKTTISGYFVSVLALGVYIFVLVATSVGFYLYPPILISSMFIIGAELLIIKRIGLISVASLFWAFVGIPALIPLLSDYIFSVSNYTLRGIVYSDPVLIRKGVFLAAVFLWIVTGSSISRFERCGQKKSKYVSYISEYTFPYTPTGFAVVSGIVLLCAYLTTPGPTILTHSYSAAKETVAWATFAGSLYMGSWIVLLFVSRQSSQRKIKYAFFFITAISVLWLLLHARRNESLGVILTAVVIYAKDFRIRDVGSSARTTLISALFSIVVFLQIVVGQIRSGPTEIDLQSIFLGGGRTIIRLPGGGHNIFATYQFTLHHFSEKNYLFGRTFANYPIQSVPTPLLKLFNIPKPEYYFNFMQMNYTQYNGGDYLLNEFLASFGSVGVVLAAFLFGVMIAKAQRLIETSEKPTLWTGIAAAFVMGIPRSTWYWQGNWINVLQAVIVTYVLYLIVTKTDKQSHETTDNSIRGAET